MSQPAWRRHDALATLIALAVLLAWDATGEDLAAARLFGNSRGFAWRDTWWASTLLHEGGRIAAWLWAVIGVGLILGAAQLLRGAHYPSHTLWTAWLCWTLCVVAYHAGARLGWQSKAV